MKKLFLPTLITSLALTLCVQPLIFAQQKPQTPVGSSVPGRPAAGSTASARRPGRSNSTAIPVIQRDFDEAVKVIQENYIEGQKLDYNAVFKSSIHRNVAFARSAFKLFTIKKNMTN